MASGGLTVKLSNIRPQSGAEKTIYVDWTFSVDKSKVEGYSVIWEYYTKGNRWFEGQSQTNDNSHLYSVYSYPDNAINVRVKVKPISKKYKPKGSKKEKTYFTGATVQKTYKVPAVAPEPPETPSVETELSGLMLDVSVNGGIGSKAVSYEIQLVQDHRLTVTVIFLDANNLGYASTKLSVSSGHDYYVAVRSLTLTAATARTTKSNDFPEGSYSEWVYSSDVTAPPDFVTGIPKASVVNGNVICVDFNGALGAVKYEIEYANDINQFRIQNGNTSTVESETNVAYIGGLEYGSWFFRVRSCNKAGVYSSWSNISEGVYLGATPTAPTTWQSSNRAIKGDVFDLHWIHNCEDNSTPKAVTITITEGDKPPYEITAYEDPQLSINSSLPSKVIDDMIKNSIYGFSTSGVSDGTTVSWKVKTQGQNGSWGPDSVTRSFQIFEKPSVFLDVYTKNKWYWDPFNFETDNIFTAPGELEGLLEKPVTLTKFPFLLLISTEPYSQTPIDYNIEVRPLESYEDVDYTGRTIIINENEPIYSKFGSFSDRGVTIPFMPYDINLQNYISYELIVTASFDSGLSATGSLIINVEFDDSGDVILNAELTFDEENLTMYIHPYCLTNDVLSGDVRLSVYRRAFDGEFIEIGKNLQNTSNITVIDPHPELNYSRYRIVSVSNTTGEVNYYDLPGEPIDYQGLVIQWDEQWQYFDTDEENEIVDPPWSGSMIKLPYNIDTNDSTNIDVENVEYVGRSFPVSYYGTQIGQTSSFSSDIDASDTETLYAIRRLMRFMGDVYIREPNGSGYWANVNVSYSTTHLETIIPISISVTRVEGGV